MRLEQKSFLRGECDWDWVFRLVDNSKPPRPGYILVHTTTRVICTINYSRQVDLLSSACSSEIVLRMSLGGAPPASPISAQLHREIDQDLDSAGAPQHRRCSKPVRGVSKI